MPKLGGGEALLYFFLAFDEIVNVIKNDSNSVNLFYHLSFQQSCVQRCPNDEITIKQNDFLGAGAELHTRRWVSLENSIAVSNLCCTE